MKKEEGRRKEEKGLVMSPQVYLFFLVKMQEFSICWLDNLALVC
jgi:hypothetical protein